MELEKILSQMPPEEKIMLLTGADNMSTAESPPFGVAARQMADGTQGVRSESGEDENCAMLPAVCCIGATWNPAAAEEAGRVLAAECIEHGVDLILGPGANLKRTPLCGRNFECVSEDPVLSGEMTAAYIRGIQHSGVGACLKHFALNNQEYDRPEINVEVDERVMRELYLKSFEIAVKKGKPQAHEDYDRDRQHQIIRKLAAEGIVLLKNEHNCLSLSAKKYRKIGVVGEYALKPLLRGQGSAEVYPAPKYIDSPLEELKKLLGDNVTVSYREFLSGRNLKSVMNWLKVWIGSNLRGNRMRS